MRDIFVIIFIFIFFILINFICRGFYFASLFLLKLPCDTSENVNDGNRFLILMIKFNIHMVIANV